MNHTQAKAALDRLAHAVVEEMELLDWDGAPWTEAERRACRRAFKRGYREDSVRRVIEAREEPPHE